MYIREVPTTSTGIYDASQLDEFSPHMWKRARGAIIDWWYDHELTPWIAGAIWGLIFGGLLSIWFFAAEDTQYHYPMYETSHTTITSHNP